MKHRRIFRSWFRDAPLEQVGQENVMGWLAWSLFDKQLNQLEPSEKEACLACLEAVERRAERKFSPGRSSVSSIRLSFDPVKITLRPLCLYLLIHSLHVYRLWTLKRLGFTTVESADGSLECLLWVPTGWQDDSTARPIVFLHGLGTGVGHYMKVVLGLINPPKGSTLRPILIPLQPSASMSLFHPHYCKPPSQAAFTSAFLEILQTLGWREKGVDAFGHSIGTVLLGAIRTPFVSLSHAAAGWILKANPKVIKRSVRCATVAVLC
jgi:hypothetical protein